MFDRLAHELLAHHRAEVGRRNRNGTLANPPGDGAAFRAAHELRLLGRGKVVHAEVAECLRECERIERRHLRLAEGVGEPDVVEALRQRPLEHERVVSGRSHLGIAHVLIDVRAREEGGELLGESRLFENKRQDDQPAVRDHLVAADLGIGREEAADDVGEGKRHRGHRFVNGVPVRAGDERRVKRVRLRAEGCARGSDDFRDVDLVHAVDVVEVRLDGVAQGGRHVERIHRPQCGHALCGQIFRKVAECLLDLGVALRRDDSGAQTVGEAVALAPDPDKIDSGT